MVLCVLATCRPAPGPGPSVHVTGGVRLRRGGSVPTLKDGENSSCVKTLRSERRRRTDLRWVGEGRQSHQCESKHCTVVGSFQVSISSGDRSWWSRLYRDFLSLKGAGEGWKTRPRDTHQTTDNECVSLKCLSYRHTQTGTSRHRRTAKGLGVRGRTVHCRRLNKFPTRRFCELETSFYNINTVMKKGLKIFEFLYVFVCLLLVHI